MATTEEGLIKRISQASKGINEGGSVSTLLASDGLTQTRCIEFVDLNQAIFAKAWLDMEVGLETIKEAFNSTSRFARLQKIKTTLIGSSLYIHFTAWTGDALGLTMISEGIEHALRVMVQHASCRDMTFSIANSDWTDKKPSAMSWIDGRGKSVIASAIIPGDVIKQVFKVDSDALVKLNVNKNLVGSAVNGSIGGFNGHAANVVTAIFLATGQDPVLNAESSNCITTLKRYSVPRLLSQT